jgi:hypothetical protein
MNLREIGKYTDRSSTSVSYTGTLDWTDLAIIGVVSHSKKNPGFWWGYHGVRKYIDEIVTILTS